MHDATEQLCGAQNWVQQYPLMRCFEEQARVAEDSYPQRDAPRLGVPWGT